MSDHQYFTAEPTACALCQRCHNVYDAPMRRAGIRHRQREAMAVAELFVDPPHPERT